MTKSLAWRSGFWGLREDMTVRFHALTLICRNQAATRDFYCSIFDAILLPGDGTCFWLSIGEMRIALLPNCTNASPAKFSSDAMFCLWLETDSLEDFIEKLHGLDIPIHEHSEDQFVLISDPDGLMIEVWKKGE